MNSGEPVDDQAEGRLIAIPCSSAGGGGSVEWSRVGGELPEQAIVSDDGTLTISSLRPEDSGQYVCTSDDGIMSAPLTLTVVPGEERPALLLHGLVYIKEQNDACS